MVDEYPVSNIILSPLCNNKEIDGPASVSIPCNIGSAVISTGSWTPPRDNPSGTIFMMEDERIGSVPQGSAAAASWEVECVLKA